MDHDIQISFEEKIVTVKLETSTHQFANLMAIDGESGKIVEVGQTEDEIAAYNPQKWAKERHKISFKPIYALGEFAPDDMCLSVWALVIKLHEHTRYFKKLSCNIEIPGYEFCKNEKQNYFEYSVQSLMMFKNLSINNKQSPLTGKKLTIARITLEYGRWIGFGLSLYLSYVNLDFLVNPFGLFYLVFILISIGVGVWAMEALWLLFIQTILPKKIVHLIFQAGYGTGRWSTSKTLARLILGNLT